MNTTYINALKAITRKEVTRFLRIWGQTILPPGITLGLYFLIFGNLIGPRIGEVHGLSYIDYIVPGLIMMSIITNSYANVVSSFFGSKFQHNIEEMLIAPIPNYIIIIGFVSGGVARGLLVGILVTIVSMFFTTIDLHHIGVTFIVAILTAILFSLAGMLNGIFAKKFDDINIVPTFVLTPLTYLGGIFYSIDMLPSYGQTATYANPIFYMVNAFRYGFLGHSELNISTSILIICGFVIAFFALVLWLLNKGVGIRT